MTNLVLCQFLVFRVEIKTLKEAYHEAVDVRRHSESTQSDSAGTGGTKKEAIWRISVHNNRSPGNGTLSQTISSKNYL